MTRFIRKTIDAITGVIAPPSTKDERTIMCVQLGWDSELDELEEHVHALINTLNVRSMEKKDDRRCNKNNTTN